MDQRTEVRHCYTSAQTYALLRELPHSAWREHQTSPKVAFNVLIRDVQELEERISRCQQDWDGW